MTQHVEPLDPDSPEGRAAVERITPVLARVRVAIAERQRQANQERQAS